MLSGLKLPIIDLKTEKERGAPMSPLKILLIAPPIFDYYFSPHRAQPLGLFYLKAALEQSLSGVEVTIYDARQSGKRRPCATPVCFDHLKDFYPPDQSQFSLFSRYTRFGDSFTKIARAVKEGGYHVIAVSSLFSGYHDDVEDLMAHIRAHCSGILVCGGWAVKAEPMNLITKTSADYLVTGDEEAFIHLIEAVQQGHEPAPLAGIVSRNKGVGEFTSQGEMCCHKDPFFVRGFPHRTGSGFIHGEPLASVTLSRGCQMRCAFCAIHRTQPYLRRSIMHVDRELTLLRESSIKIVNFEDDHLFADSATSTEFLDMLATHHAGGLRFMAMNGITAPRLAPFAGAALDAGFCEFNLSLVSSQPDVASHLDRPVFLPAIESIAAESLGRADVVVFIILGLPGQTPAGALSDILTLASLPVTIGVSPLYLIPGIPLFEAMGLPTERRLMRGSALYQYPPGFRREDVVALWKLTRMLGAIKRSAAQEEHLHYFGRSLQTRKWHRLNEGSWTPYLENPLLLPKRICVTTSDGKALDWYPYEGRIDRK